MRPPANAIFFTVTIGGDCVISKFKHVLVEIGKRNRHGEALKQFKMVAVQLPINELLSKKRYIACGEECAICLEPMFFKTNASLLICGHAFHSTCLHSADCAKDLHENGDELISRCPLCRSQAPFDIQAKSRYRCCICGGNAVNPIHSMIDQLECFQDTRHLVLPRVCYWSFEYTTRHYIGMMARSCENCKHYCKTGHELW